MAAFKRFVLPPREESAWILDDDWEVDVRSVWRRVVVGSASAAVAASLLVVPTSVVSSSEVVETPASGASQPGDTGAVVPAMDPASTDVGPLRDKSKIFGETLMRLQVNMGKDDPVVRGKVRVRSIEGKLLLRGYTNAVGQVVFLTQQEMPDRVVVRVRGGQSKGLKGDSIDLRAFFEPRDGEVVDVNPLTTMDELCRSGNYGTYCSTAVDSFYRLKGSVDYRDLVAISSRWFDGSRFGRDAARRGLTTWQWAERVLLKAYAGKKTPKVKGQSGRSDVTARSGAATAASWTFAGVGQGLMRSAGGGIAGSLAARYFNKLMVAAGVFEGQPDVVGEIDSLRREMRQHFADVQRGIDDLKVGQAQMQDQLRNLYGAVQGAQYAAAVNAFDVQDRRTRLVDLMDTWRFLADYLDCMATQEEGCSSTSAASPEAQSAQDLDICGLQARDAARGAVAEQAVVLCAQFRRVLADYASRFTVNAVRDRVLGINQSNDRGLVPMSQEVFARTNLSGIVTGQNQGAMMRMGDYWMGEWAKDKALWAVITADPRLVNRLSSGADTAIRQARELQDRYDEVAADATGRFFPVRIPAACNFAFYDMDTKRMYARGFTHYFNLAGGKPGDWPLRANAPRLEGTPAGAESCPWLTPSDIAPENGPSLKAPWSAASTSLVPSLANAISHMRRIWPSVARDSPRPERPARIGVGLMNEANGCYRLRLADHMHSASGHVIMCPFIDYGGSASAQVKDDGGRPAMACVTSDGDANVMSYGDVDIWSTTFWSRLDKGEWKSAWGLVRGCADPSWGSSGGYQGFFPGKDEGEWSKCSRRFVGICTRTDKGPFKAAEGDQGDRTKTIGGGYIRDYLPYYANKVPNGVSPRKMTSWVHYNLLTMPYAGAVPGS